MTAVAVRGIEHGRSIAAGRDHACVVTDQGSVWCWGSGQLGQLGSGRHHATEAPHEVPGIRGAVAISAGTGFSCAALAAPLVRCWGSTSGRLSGTADARDETRALEVGDVTAMASGPTSTCAIVRPGGVRCWESIHGAEHRSAENRSGAGVPPPEVVPVSNLRDAVAIAVGEGSACAGAEGGLTCWETDPHTTHRYSWDQRVDRVAMAGAVPCITSAVAVECGDPELLARG